MGGGEGLGCVYGRGTRQNRAGLGGGQFHAVCIPVEVDEAVSSALVDVPAAARRLSRLCRHRARVHSAATAVHVPRVPARLLPAGYRFALLPAPPDLTKLTQGQDVWACAKEHLST